MNKFLTLPKNRVDALAAETNEAPEVAVAKLLSVLHSREMWAHYCRFRSNEEEAVFLYGPNVPTPEHATS